MNDQHILSKFSQTVLNISIIDYVVQLIWNKHLMFIL